ncbi:hypothetical protein [Absidia glauca]|uniref:Atos-like conserved domain-containing protein n=1 Tax=Absidia glauca TaxID=4829 RepID=A0A163K844_ABSGL|nr:hypothetical protein [Absidia glauca]
MVTLINSSYYAGDPPGEEPSTSPVGHLVRQLIPLVLKSRLGSDYYCVQAHHPTAPTCYLTLTDNAIPPLSTMWQLSIGITYQHTLLERWIIQWQPAAIQKTHMDTSSLLQAIDTPAAIQEKILDTSSLILQAIDTHIRVLPLYNVLAHMAKSQVGFVITTNDPHHPGCHSLDSPPLADSTSATTTCIGSMDDPVGGQLDVKVVYDEHVGRILTKATPTPPVPFLTLPSTIGRRRLSRLSLSALDDEQQDHSLPLAIPLSTSPIQYTHHGHSLAYSTLPTPTYQRRLSLPIHSQHLQHHGLAGNYEESLLSGRMSTLLPSKPIWFHAQIGVLGHGRVKSALRCPPHCSVVFPAYFYNGQQQQEQEVVVVQTVASTLSPPPPFVGTVDLSVDQEGIASPGYRIPSKGQLQIAIKNPNKFLVKLFLVPYDVSAMPRNTKTFLRQKAYLQSSPLVLKYAVHLQLCRTDKNRVYLYNQVRVVFVNRSLDAREQLLTVCEGPKEPVYSPLK